ncbi:MAG: S9 family peptidase [Arenimonas sp.]|nr:S9 family peptidase [Arenimonas sp.]
MIRQLLSIVAFACIATPAIAQNAAQTKLNSAGALFGVRETVQQIDLSPDGNRVVYISPGPGRTTIALVAEVGSTAEPQVAIASNGKPESLTWCKFVSNTRLICQFYGIANAGSFLVPYSRLLALDIDGKNVKMLGQQSSQYDKSYRQFDGEIIDWLPNEEDAVLMARQYIPESAKMGTKLVRTEEGVGVDHIDTRTMQTSKLENASKQAEWFISDGHGNIRIKAYRPVLGATGQTSDKIIFSYRKAGSTEWLAFSNWENRTGMLPIGVDDTSNSAYVLKNLDGRLALYRVKLDGSMTNELVFKNDKVDIDDIVRINSDSKIIGVSYAEEKRKIEYFDPKYAKLTASIGKALPNLPIIGIVQTSSDEKKILIFAGSDSDPGRYYVFDANKVALNEILLARPALENQPLASVKAINYPAADGTQIPAYLTLPPGKENAKGLPAVVLPHGGPSARDEWGFDWLSQFLANQGYAVIQPNYRGSEGYGDDWMQENGFKSWRTSIGDVTSAGNWLISQGIANPKQLAIVGWSYGGYAALQANVLDPSLFKAIVAIAPVTDLDMVKAEASITTGYHSTIQFIGNGSHVQQGSPLQNVDKIIAPVLMFHGDMDLNVGVQQSRKMDAKLKSAGKPSELIVYEGLEHQLADSNARAQMLDKIAAFLKANLPAQ